MDVATLPAKQVFSSFSKTLKIRYTLMDCYLVDVHGLSQAFGGARIWNFETDGAAIYI